MRRMIAYDENDREVDPLKDNVAVPPRWVEVDDGKVEECTPLPEAGQVYTQPDARYEGIG